MFAAMPYRKQDGVIVTDLDDEIVLLDTNSKKMFSLNTIGRLVWHECLGHSVEFAVERIITAYDVDPQLVRKDVENIINELLSSNLIVYADERATLT